MRIALRLAPVLGAFVLLPTAGAHATTFCVPTVAACPGGVGTAQPNLQTALALADDSADPDEIHLGSGTFTAPSTAGFGYNLAAGPIRVYGKGKAGADRTTLTAPAGAATIFRIAGANGSGVDGLAIAIPDNEQGSKAGLALNGVAATNVAITASATQANTFYGVDLDSGSSLSDSSVTLPPPSSAQNYAVLVEGPGVTLSRLSLVGQNGLATNSGAQSTVADRLQIAATAGVQANGSTITLRASTITVTSSPGSALSALDQPGSDALLDADGVTIRSPLPGTYGAVASSIFAAPRKSTIALRNSIVVTPFGRRVSASSTGVASVTASSSEYDPSGDSLVGTGPMTLSPPAGQLGATNINADPQFVSPTDSHLTASSPAIDAADPATAAGLDLDGAPWLLDRTSGCLGRRDMGAYEYQATSAPCPSPSAEPSPLAVAPGPSTLPRVTPKPTPGTTVPKDITAPKITALRVRRGVLSFRLSEKAGVTVVRTGARKRSTTRRSAKAGTTRLRLPKRLHPGRYAIRVAALDAAGNRSRPKTLRFRVGAAKVKR